MKYLLSCNLILLMKMQHSSIKYCNLLFSLKQFFSFDSAFNRVYSISSSLSLLSNIYSFNPSISNLIYSKFFFSCSICFSKLDLLISIYSLSLSIVSLMSSNCSISYTLVTLFISENSFESLFSLFCNSNLSLYLANYSTP